jgi:DNA mismatch endonuclease (patch repair protein)
MVTIGALRPVAASVEVERRMKSQRRRDTAPEVALRRELWRRGLRYRVDHRVVGRRRRVDIAFTRARVAVFVDGCFWHSCPHHATRPKNNAEWWATKLQANVGRDRATDAELIASGWTVLRLWEHEPVDDAADRVEAAVIAGRLIQEQHSGS